MADTRLVHVALRVPSLQWVVTLDTPFADSDAEALRVMFNELVLTLRR